MDIEKCRGVSEGGRKGNDFLSGARYTAPDTKETCLLESEVIEIAIRKEGARK